MECFKNFHLASFKWKVYIWLSRFVSSFIAFLFLFISHLFIIYRGEISNFYRCNAIVLFIFVLLKTIGIVNYTCRSKQRLHTKGSFWTLLMITNDFHATSNSHELLFICTRFSFLSMATEGCWAKINAKTIKLAPCFTLRPQKSPCYVHCFGKRQNISRTCTVNNDNREKKNLKKKVLINLYVRHRPILAL